MTLPKNSEFQLGKKEYVHDERSLMMANYLAPELYFPSKFDFDEGRKQFPSRTWGNNEWGDCVVAGRTNHLLRLERVETRYTPPFRDQHVIDKYKELSGAKTPGDANDVGLWVLGALRDWRFPGWTVEFPKGGVRNYRISAFGEIDPQDQDQLRTCIYLLHGCQLGIWLPLTAYRQLQDAVQSGTPCRWEVVPDSGAAGQPGSWGGHLVYCKAYNSTEFECLTWGMKVMMTDAFVDKYVDEAWAVVDAFSPWVNRRELDIEAMKKKLIDIGAVGVEAS